MAFKHFALFSLFLASVFCSDPVQLHPEEQCILIRKLQELWKKDFEYRRELQDNATDYLLMSNENLKEALRHGRYKKENSRILDLVYYERWDPREHFPEAAQWWFADEDSRLSWNILTEGRRMRYAWY
ncbi:unnamed protein product [Cylicocyclus nassatus]|uniref:Uncharacterized protein n=1 Tax=Cylicocyclus nassatus TaxID=53992 RepID=A0AA36GEX1_CYLNA|nr:unnamed protein product [Cylicocyclus nassatus]